MKTPKKLKGAKSPLELEVQQIINYKASDYDHLKDLLNDLFQSGCESGMIGQLVYYEDTVDFYKRHGEEIDALLKETCSNYGMTHLELFGDKWDKDDLFAREQFNQNLLAWFGFEETARKLADKNGIEV